MGGIREERRTCAQRVEPRPPLGILVVPVWPYAIEVHLPSALPQGTPLIRIDVDDRAHHVAVVLGAPAAAADTRDARGTTRVGLAGAEEDRDGVDVRVVEEETCRVREGEGRRRGVHAGYLDMDDMQVEWKGGFERQGQRREARMKWRKASVRAIRRA